jgi:hypothetical protein
VAPPARRSSKAIPRKYPYLLDLCHSIRKTASADAAPTARFARGFGHIWPGLACARRVTEKNMYTWLALGSSADLAQLESYILVEFGPKTGSFWIVCRDCDELRLGVP